MQTYVCHTTDCIYTEKGRYGQESRWQQSERQPIEELEGNQGEDPRSGTRGVRDTGLERATVRTIAQMANIHPSMVMRYYTNKEGLFAASAPFNLHLPDFSEADRGNAGERIIRTFLDRWENLA